MFSHDVWKSAACSDSEKRELIPLVKLLIHLSQMTRKEGLLILEDLIDGYDEFILAKGLQLIVDGNDPEIVRDTLLTLMYAGNFSGKELLKRMIIADALCLIQSGNDYVVRQKLYSYLGEAIEKEFFISDYNEESTVTRTVEPEEQCSVTSDKVPPPPDTHCIETLTAILKENGRIVSRTPASAEEIHRLAEKAKSSAWGLSALMKVLNKTDFGVQQILLDGFSEYEPELFASIEKSRITIEDISRCNDRSVQKILREIDTQDLVFVLIGANEKVKDKIISNMSRRAAKFIKEDLGFLGPVRKESVEAAQRKFLTIMYSLADSGDIIIPRNGEVLM